MTGTYSRIIHGETWTWDVSAYLPGGHLHRSLREPNDFIGVRSWQGTPEARQVTARDARQAWPCVMRITPVLAVTYVDPLSGGTAHLLLDGHKRMMRAALAYWRHVPAHVLSLEKSEECRVIAKSGGVE